MADRAHEWTDGQIEDLCKRFHEVYDQAEREMRERLGDFFETFEQDNARWLDMLDSGEVTRREYDHWLESQTMNREWMESMVDRLSNDAVNADRICMNMVADDVPRVFAENANWEAFDVCHATKLDLNFTLYNEDAVRRLMANDGRVVSVPRFNEAADIAWNRRKFTSCITQSILQGESVPRAAARIATVFGMGERAATRAARTAMTGAESAGRQHSMERAESMGVPIKKTWRANLDGRTRQAHRDLDGVTIPVSEYFTWDYIKAERPGDPECPPEFICNCRCRLISEIDVDGIPPAVVSRTSHLPSSVTYEQWKSGTYRTNAVGVETPDSKAERGVE